MRGHGSDWECICVTRGRWCSQCLFSLQLSGVLLAALQSSSVAGFVSVSFSWSVSGLLSLEPALFLLEALPS